MYYQKIYIGNTFLILAQTKSDFYILTKIFTWIVYLFIYYSSINYYPSLILCCLNIQIVKEKKKKREALKGNFDFVS